MTAYQACEDVGQIGVGIGAAEFAALYETGEDSPVLGAYVAGGEERILFRFRAMGRLARSAGLVSCSTRSSFRYYRILLAAQKMLRIQTKIQLDLINA